MKRPTDILREEHRVIEQVLDCLKVVASRCKEEGKLDGEPAQRILDFLRTFADRCHHRKEEKELFPAMESRGYSMEAGPVAVMLAEHTRGRELIGAMESSLEAASRGDEAACATFHAGAGAYRLLLREHIEKEEHCLFPMADQALTQADQVALEESFRRAEEQEVGPDVPARYRQIAQDLVEQLAPAVPT